MRNKQEREDLRILFNNDAGYYDNYRLRNSFVARSDFKNTKKRLLSFLNCQKTDSILEVECGEGTWTELIAPLCTKYDAVDISGEMLRIDKKRKGCEKANFFYTTFESFNTNEQYDKIFMVRVFEYMKDKNEMLKKYADY
jgi:ubiquinone/menaquinone biosynthesis C-methylase UbiE